eukprot:g2820.t1
MGYVKVVKNSAYFSRYQVKLKRRRQGKTDYRARRAMCSQDKNKYNCPKYRMIVRFTNKDIICQIAYATLQGDVIIAAAYAHELPRYGVKVGLTNYAAGYCVGLLLARRLLTKLGLDTAYVGLEEATGEDYNVEEEGERKPFYCILDTGLVRTTSGAKVFACLKGALDGGLDIPHKEKRFVGYDAESGKMDIEVLKNHIYGGHVSDYMSQMKEDDPDKYEAHFSQYIKAGIEPDDLEDMYRSAHEKIRDDPVMKKSTKKSAPSGGWPVHRQKKMTHEEKKEALQKRITALMEIEDE